MVVLRRGPGALSWLIFAWFFPSFVIAGIVNRTIDDTFGDSQTGLQVTYLPGGPQVWQDETCVGCAIQPDVQNAFKETYTAATYNPGLGSINITMQFNGTAIYVFFILANNAGDGITTLTLANFTLDGNPPQLFQHAPDLTTTNIEFNQLVFAQTNLINAQHTLVISTSGVDTNVYVNFDYAIYTHDDDDPLLPLTGGSISQVSTSPSTTGTSTAAPSLAVTSTATPSPSTTALDNVSDTKSKGPGAGPIAGGVIAAFLIIALIFFLIYFYHRRRRSKGPNTREVEGYVPPLMLELDPERDRQATVISPFVQPAPSTTYYSGSQQLYAPVSANSMSRLSMPLSNTEVPMAHSEVESAYGGYMTPGASSQQASSRSTSAPSNSDIPSYYQGGQSSRPLRSVTDRDHLSATEDTLSATTPPTPNNIEAIRLARQNELDQRMRTVQEEMTYLASDLSSEEKSGRSRSVRRRTRNRPGEGGEAVEEEMSMSDMREQLRSMREQIAYLQDQQRSAWAQGLSDDPPPGYTAARTSSRYSVPPTTAGLSVS